MNDLKEIIKNKKYNILRTMTKKSLTCRLGNLEENDKELVCHVDKKRIRNKFNEYKIVCRGSKTSEINIKEYNLDKKILYIIEDMQFDKGKVYIAGYDNCEIIIKNCRFDKGLEIYVDGKCKLENSYVANQGNMNIQANELIIKDMNIKNQIWNPYTDLSVSLIADHKIEIINSNIGEADNRTNIEIKNPEKLNIVNSKLIGYNNINITSANTKYDNESSAKIIRNLPVKTEVVLFDGSIKQEENKEKEEMAKRQEVIKTLKQIKEKCEIIDAKIKDKKEKALIRTK